MTPHLVFLLEERSAGEMIDRLLPRMFGDQITYRCILFEGKQDLEKQLVKRIRWYLADLQAVERGLGLRNLARQQGKRKFRNPDQLPSPSRELTYLTKGRYQKIAGSRAIAPWLDLDNSRSNSFRVFIEGVRLIAGAPVNQ